MSLRTTVGRRSFDASNACQMRTHDYDAAMPEMLAPRLHQFVAVARAEHVTRAAQADRRAAADAEPRHRPGWRPTSASRCSSESVARLRLTAAGRTLLARAETGARRAGRRDRRADRRRRPRPGPGHARIPVHPGQRRRPAAAARVPGRAPRRPDRAAAGQARRAAGPASRRRRGPRASRPRCRTSRASSRRRWPRRTCASWCPSGHRLDRGGSAAVPLAEVAGEPFLAFAPRLRAAHPGAGRLVPGGRVRATDRVRGRRRSRRCGGWSAPGSA